jgi:hypothetical protein
MDFAAFEQVVLQVLFETREPLSAPHLAYVAGIPVQKAERYLARLVEQGTVIPRLGTHGMVEYVFPGRRALPERQRALAGADDEPSSDAGDLQERPEPEAFSSATAVLLSVVIPGAGHIYAGRSGAGVAWMASTLAGYVCFVLPGLFLHGLCLVSAAHARNGVCLPEP